MNYWKCQGGKKIIFAACHSGKLKLAFTSPDVISTSPKSSLLSRIDFTLLLLFESAKNINCPSGKLKTDFTSPIAKSTSPRLSDTTFFALWNAFWISLQPDWQIDNGIFIRTIMEWYKSWYTDRGWSGRGGMMLSKYRELISAFNTKLSIIIWFQGWLLTIESVDSHNTFIYCSFQGLVHYLCGKWGEVTILRKLRRFPKYSVF